MCFAAAGILALKQTTYFATKLITHDLYVAQNCAALIIGILATMLLKIEQRSTDEIITACFNVIPAMNTLIFNCVLAWSRLAITEPCVSFTHCHKGHKNYV